MFGITNNLKLDKWYTTEDGYKIMFHKYGLITVNYGGTTVSIDVPKNIVSNMIFKSIIPDLNALDKEPISDDVFLEELSLKELNTLMNDMLEEEDYETCKKIQKIINEKEKNNKKS